MNPFHWLNAAEQLVRQQRAGAPRQVNLRCAVSLTYYAMFHWLANCAAGALAGSSRPRDASWTRVYRSIDHRQVRRRCRRRRIPRGFSATMRRFAIELASLQSQRHAADYDPDARFSKGDVLEHLATVEDILTAADSVTPAEKRALAIHALFRERPGSA